MRGAVPFLILGAVLITALAAVLLYSPDPPEGGTVRRVYFADNISPAHQFVIDRFNREYAGRIEVVPVDLPFRKFSTNERKELLARSLRNKSDRIDIFSVDQIWVPRFSRWSEPLDHLIAKDEAGRILSYALESCVFDSHLVAIPLYIDVGMLYYRRDLVRSLPDGAAVEHRLKESITWDELLTLAGRLDLRGAPMYLFQADNFEGLVCNYFELLAGQDRNAFAGNRVDLSTPEAHRALQMLVDFVHRYRISPREVSQYDEIQSYIRMLRSGGAFVRGWPNFIENYTTFYHEPVDIENIGRAALPHFAGHQPVSVFGGWNLMISRHSPNKEAALTFARFLQREESQKVLFDVGGYIPSNEQVYRDSAFMARRPDLQYYRKLLDHGFHRPQLIGYTRISDIIANYAHRAIKGELTVSEALRRASLTISNERAFHE
ncbi:MAG: extracellular solute-binding protein [Bacteroidota bacterium]